MRCKEVVLCLQPIDMLIFDCLRTIIIVYFCNRNMIAQVQHMTVFLQNCFNVASLRDAGSEYILSPHKQYCLYGVIEIQPLRGCKKSVI